MNQTQRSALVVGGGLVLVGGLALLCQLIPALHAVFATQFSWPLIVVGVGVMLLVLGVLIGVPDMAIPAAIVGGIGCLLYWQNATGNWLSWAYAWTLIPAFVGVGMIVGGLLNGQIRKRLASSAVLVLISLTGFALFGALIDQETFAFGPYWPVLLILLGTLLLIRPLLRS